MFYKFHCVKSVHISSFSRPYFHAPYSVQMQENIDQENSEYGHVSCSVLCAEN